MSHNDSSHYIHQMASAHEKSNHFNFFSMNMLLRYLFSEYSLQKNFSIERRIANGNENSWKIFRHICDFLNKVQWIWVLPTKKIWHELSNTDVSSLQIAYFYGIHRIWIILIPFIYIFHHISISFLKFLRKMLKSDQHNKIQYTMLQTDNT